MLALLALLHGGAGGGWLAPARASAPASGPPASTLFAYSDPQINESSGIAASSFDDTFYTFNDSGDSARFFRVDERGRTVAVYSLAGARNVDWEDMATGVDDSGRHVLYFGDIGDNQHIRKEIAVYEVLEPRAASADVTWTRYRFSYPDGAHDAEALLVDPRTHRIFIATKELLDNGKLYQAPDSLSTTSVNDLASVGSVPPLTTSGDFAPDGSRVVLLTYATAFWADDVGGAWRRFSVPLPRQAEAIAYSRDGSSVLVGGEGAHSVVYRVPAPAGGLRPTSAAQSAAVASPATEPVKDQSSSPNFPIAVAVVSLVAVLAGLGALVVWRSRNR